jgi:hypothetical protein
VSEDLGSAVLELRADGSGIDRDLDATERNVGGRMSRIGGGLAKVGGALTAGITVPAALAAGKMVSLASDAAETANKLKVTFGGATDNVVARLDKFAAATGASRYALREQAATVGALLKPMGLSAKAHEDMSVATVKLSKDLSSFHNVAEDDALEKLRAGLVGEAEPLRAMGVLLNEANVKERAYAMGIAKRGEELTEAQKVQARYAEILAQTKDAQGDATNTADSFANRLKAVQNQARDVGTELGAKLMPIAEKLVAWALKGVNAFGQLSPRMQMIVLVGGGLAAIIPPILLGVGALLMVLPALGAALGAISLPVVAVVAGLVALGAAVVWLWRNNEDFRDGVKQIWAQIQRVIDTVLTELRATITVWVGWAKSFWREFGDNIKNQAQTVWGGIRGVISGVLDVIRGVIKTALSLLRGDWQGAWDGLELIVSGAWTAIKSLVGIQLGLIKTALSTAWTAIKTVASTAWDGFKDVIGDAIGAVPGLARNALSGLGGLLADVGASAGAKFAGAIKGAINAVLDKIRSFRIPGFKIGKKKFGGQRPFAGLPSFARGGITDGISIAGEDGPEAIVPLGRSSRNRSDRERVLREAGLDGARADRSGPLIGEVNVYDTNVDVPQFVRTVAWYERTVGAY